MKRSDVPSKTVIEACMKFHKNIDRTRPLEQIMKATGVNEKVAYAAMMRDEDSGYIDCGVSLATAWPTEKGMEVLNGT